MSVKERARLVVFSRVRSGEISVGKAGELAGLSLRQAKRIWKRYRKDGDRGLVHRLRGRPSNASDGELREKVLELCRRRFADFGSVLAAEYLQAEGIEISPKTLWRWRREAGQLARARRRGRHRSRRERRPCVGELVQMDGSTHDWFEDRGERCVLFVMIDDATNRLFCRFYASEDTASAFDLFGRYVRKYGLPKSLYVDKDSIYRVNEPQEREQARDRGQVPQTQFGRAMKQLGVEVICANSPQAKGRVERVNATLQDRLVKALRVQGISTIDAANKYLQRTYLSQHNRKFMKKAADAVDVHRQVPAGLVLGEVLCVQEKRIVSRDWCVSYNGKTLQIDKRHTALSLAGRPVTVLELANGKLQLKYKDQVLRWEVLGSRAELEQDKQAPKATKPAARPAAALETPRRASASPPVPKEPWRPAEGHPWRRSASRLLRSGQSRCAPLPSAPQP